MKGLGQAGTLLEMAGNSPFKEQPSPFVHGVIAFIDTERWTVTVEVHETGARQYNVPIMSPYFFREKGQGAYFMPEVGSQCLLCYAYGQPFVLGFLPPVDPKSMGATSIENLSKEAGVTQSSDTSNAPPVPSYRNNRDGDMLPGDFCFLTRARNRIKIFTNGNILVEATKLCMRIYSKLKNWITDYCVNYTMNTPGGQINFTNSDTGETNYKREIRQNVADLGYSYTEKIGAEGAVSNRIISDPVAGIPQYNEQINQDGSVEITSTLSNQKITMDLTQIKLEYLAGLVSSLVMDPAGVTLYSLTPITITTPTLLNELALVQNITVGAQNIIAGAKIETIATTAIMTYGGTCTMTSPVAIQINGLQLSTIKPLVPLKGHMYYNEGSGHVSVYTGSAWRALDWND